MTLNRLQGGTLVGVYIALCFKLPQEISSTKPIEIWRNAGR